MSGVRVGEFDYLARQISEFGPISGFVHGRQVVLGLNNVAGYRCLTIDGKTENDPMKVLDARMMYAKMLEITGGETS